MCVCVCDECVDVDVPSCKSCRKRRGLTWRHKFKSSTRLFALESVCILVYSLHQ